MPVKLIDYAQTVLFDEDIQSDIESTPSGRLLQAVEILCRNGAMTYKELALALGISKAATWRLVATLREAHWVCIRHGGTRIQLDHRLDLLFSTAAFADSEFSAISDDMNEVSASVSVHIDLFCPNRKGILQLHDTTRRLTVSAPGIEVPDDKLMLAMYAAMTPPQFERHAAHVKTSDDPDLASHVAIISSRRRIQQFPGQVWGADGRSLIIAVRGQMGTAAAIRIAQRTASAKRARLIDAFNALLKRVEGKMDLFGNGTPMNSLQR